MVKSCVCLVVKALAGHAAKVLDDCHRLTLVMALHCVLHFLREGVRGVLAGCVISQMVVVPLCREWVVWVLRDVKKTRKMEVEEAVPAHQRKEARLPHHYYYCC